MNHTQLLKETIALLEKKQALEFTILKENTHGFLNDIKPSNILRNTLQHTFSLPNINDSLVKNALGLGVGFVAQKLLLKNKNSAGKKVLATVINLVVANVVATHADKIKSWGSDLLDSLKKNIDEDADKDLEKEFIIKSD